MQYTQEKLMVSWYMTTVFGLLMAGKYSIAHVLMTDDPVYFHICLGTWIMINAYALHHNPHVWKDPEVLSNYDNEHCIEGTL